MQLLSHRWHDSKVRETAKGFALLVLFVTAFAGMVECDERYKDWQVSRHCIEPDYTWHVSDETIEQYSVRFRSEEQAASDCWDRIHHSDPKRDWP